LVIELGKVIEARQAELAEKHGDEVAYNTVKLRDILIEWG